MLELLVTAHMPTQLDNATQGCTGKLNIFVEIIVASILEMLVTKSARVLTTILIPANPKMINLDLCQVLHLHHSQDDYTIQVFVPYGKASVGPLFV